MPWPRVEVHAFMGAAALRPELLEQLKEAK
jgi:hypothetical protein